MKPLVSIITPTYNHEKYIGACLDSVITQTYRHWEQIVVDDGSTDGTWDIVCEYATRDDRIRPLRQKNKGIWRLAETYNFALTVSTGALVAILEGDDVWQPHKLARQVPRQTRSGLAISFGRAKFIGKQMQVLAADTMPGRAFGQQLAQASGKELFFRYLIGDFPIPAVTVLINRRCLDQIGGFQQADYLPLVDYPTWITLGHSFGGYLFVDDVLGSWRQYAEQTTWILSHEMAYGIYRFAVEFIELNYSGAMRQQLQKSLLSSDRRNYLADSAHRSALVAARAGNCRQAWSFCRDVLGAGGVIRFARCVTLGLWKLLVNLLRV
jgi:glycosyltransferase involved in cell wall biosynthesis